MHGLSTYDDDESVEYEVVLPAVPGAGGEPAHEEGDQDVGQGGGDQAGQPKQLSAVRWRDVPVYSANECVPTFRGTHLAHEQLGRFFFGLASPLAH